MIADNGNGFTLPTRQIIKPFISGKDDGMGLGLHITNQILKISNAALIFPETGDYKIPEEFQHGAKVVFQFNIVEK